MWQRRARKARKKGQHQNQNPNPNKDSVCWHCGKKGHLSTECWSNPKNQSGSGGTQEVKGKTKSAIGKGVGSLEQGEQAAVAEPQPQPALASSLDLAHLDQEGRLRWTYDTGAAISDVVVVGRGPTKLEDEHHACCIWTCPASNLM